MREGDFREVNLKEPALREGVTISGAMHGVALALMLFGTDFLSARESAPLNVTEVTLVDGQELEAAVSTAPSVPKDQPDEPKPEDQKDVALLDLSVPDVSIQVPNMPTLSPDDRPNDTPPDFSEVLVPPPPTSVVTEPPRASIAEIPTPQEVLLQAPTPESPPATQEAQALAAAPKLEDAPRAPAPPEAEPEAAPKPEPDPEAEQKPEPEPEETKPVEAQEPEEQPAEDPGENAPTAAAPQTAKLPVAKPAKVAAAAQAASAQEKPTTPEKPEETQQEEAAQKPAPSASSSPSQFSGIITRGEKDALRLGIKRHFVYSGSTADRSLRVTVEVRLAEDASIIGKPKLIEGSGGTKGTQDVLYRAGYRALLKAEAAGEFKKLPPEKYNGWKLIHVTFTPEQIGFSS